MHGLEESAPGTPANAALVGTHLQQWQGTLKQLQTWSSAINYKRLPENTLAQTQALIESIEYLVLRLVSAVHVRQQSVEILDEQQLKQLRPVYDACIESLQVISNALAELKPIPELPDTGSLIRELESHGDDLRQPAAREAGDQASAFSFISATSQLRSLIDAIHDCRDRANALDWAAWNRNYF
jgi:hypothetical protein